MIKYLFAIFMVFRVLSIRKKISDIYEYLNPGMLNEEMDLLSPFYVKFGKKNLPKSLDLVKKIKDLA